MASPFDALSGQPRVSVQSGVWIGLVSTPPTAPGQSMQVTIDGLDHARIAVTVTGWHPAVLADRSVVLPFTGDTVTVAFDADAQARCVSWEIAA